MFSNAVALDALAAVPTSFDVVTAPACDDAVVSILRATACFQCRHLPERQQLIDSCVNYFHERWSEISAPALIYALETLTLSSDSERLRAPGSLQLEQLRQILQAIDFKVAELDAMMCIRVLTATGTQFMLRNSMVGHHHRILLTRLRHFSEELPRDTCALISLLAFVQPTNDEHGLVKHCIETLVLCDGEPTLHKLSRAVRAIPAVTASKHADSAKVISMIDVAAKKCIDLMSADFHALNDMLFTLFDPTGSKAHRDAWFRRICWHVDTNSLVATATDADVVNFLRLSRHSEAFPLRAELGARFSGEVSVPPVDILRSFIILRRDNLMAVVKFAMLKHAPALVAAVPALTVVESCWLVSLINDLSDEYPAETNSWMPDVLDQINVSKLTLSQVHSLLRHSKSKTVSVKCRTALMARMITLFKTDRQADIDDNLVRTSVGMITGFNEEVERELLNLLVKAVLGGGSAKRSMKYLFAPLRRFRVKDPRLAKALIANWSAFANRARKDGSLAGSCFKTFTADCDNLFIVTEKSTHGQEEEFVHKHLLLVYRMLATPTCWEKRTAIHMALRYNMPSKLLSELLLHGDDKVVTALGDVDGELAFFMAVARSMTNRPLVPEHLPYISEHIASADAATLRHAVRLVGSVQDAARSALTARTLGRLQVLIAGDGGASREDSDDVEREITACSYVLSNLFHFARLAWTAKSNEAKDALDTLAASSAADPADAEATPDETLAADTFLLAEASLQDAFATCFNALPMDLRGALWGRMCNSTNSGLRGAPLLLLNKLGVSLYGALDSLRTGALLHLAEQPLPDEMVPRVVAELQLRPDLNAVVLVSRLERYPIAVSVAGLTRVAPTMAFSLCVRAVVSILRIQPFREELFAIAATRAVNHKAAAGPDDMNQLMAVTADLDHPLAVELRRGLCDLTAVTTAQSLMHFLATQTAAQVSCAMPLLRSTIADVLPSAAVEDIVVVCEALAKHGPLFPEVVEILKKVLDAGNDGDRQPATARRIQTAMRALKCLDGVDELDSARAVSAAESMVRDVAHGTDATGRSGDVADALLSAAAGYNTARMAGRALVVTAVVAALQQAEAATGTFRADHFARLVVSCISADAWDEARAYIVTALDHHLAELDAHVLVTAFRTVGDDAIRAQLGQRMLKRVVLMVPLMSADDVGMACTSVQHYGRLEDVEAAVDALGTRFIEESANASRITRSRVLACLAHFEIKDPMVVSLVIDGISGDRRIDGRTAANLLRDLGRLGVHNPRLTHDLVTVVDEHLHAMPLRSIVTAVCAVAEMQVLYSLAVQHMFQRLASAREALQQNGELKAAVCEAAEVYRTCLPANSAKMFLGRPQRL
jgi:hypothetical protein